MPESRIPQENSTRAHENENTAWNLISYRTSMLPWTGSLKELDAGTEKLPEKAIRECRQHRELMIPRLIAAIRQAAARRTGRTSARGKCSFLCPFSPHGVPIAGGVPGHPGCFFSARGTAVRPVRRCRHRHAFKDSRGVRRRQTGNLGRLDSRSSNQRICAVGGGPCLSLPGCATAVSRKRSHRSPASALASGHRR